jgi:hypothetical protein
MDAMYKTIVPVLIAAALIACDRKGGQKQISTGVEEVAAQLPAGFAEFYEKFHQDSLYQIAHISWPLSGETSVQEDSLTSRRVPTNWQKEQWRMHQPIDLSTGEFKRSFIPMGDDIVVEKIRYANAGFGLERRFTRRSDGEWELIYYADMSEVR